MHKLDQKYYNILNPNLRFIKDRGLCSDVFETKQHTKEPKFDPKSFSWRCISNMNKLRTIQNGVLVFALFCKTPVVQFSALFKLISPVVLKPWTWKAIAPAAVSSLSIHSLSGATTYVTSSSSNSVQGTTGSSFNFPFWSGGNYRAYSFKVDGLPAGLSYNGNSNAPSISGTLPNPGNYNISITGYRYPGLSGNRTPTYNLSLNVTGVQNHTLTLSSGVGGTVSGGGAYQQGSSPTIIANPSPGYSFASWSGAGVANSSSPTTTVDMSQARSVTANFSALSYTLSVNANSGGSASGGGSYNYGDTPTITASPLAGYRFLSWSGSGVSNPASSSTTVSITQARSITASFQPLVYDLSLSSGIGGRVSGDGNYTHGQSPTINAIPDTGYSFSSWSGNGVANSSSSTTTVSMTQSRSISATFTPLQYSLNLTSGNGGSVSGSGLFSHGSTATITATPDTGYSFTSWQGEGTENTNSATTTVDMSQTRSLSAVFSILRHSLSLTAGSGGIVNGGGTYDHGQNAIIVATPNTGYSFSSWTGSGVANPNSPNTTVTVSQPTTISANFRALSYALNLTSGAGGTVSGSGTFIHGETPTIVATPNAGYTFSSWSGPGINNPNSSTTTVSMVAARDISASFSVINHDLTLSTTGGGIISGGGTYAFGSRVPINAVPDTNFTFLNWSGPGLDDPNSSSTFATITGDLSITANFTTKSATDLSLILTSLPSAGGIALGAGSYPPGASVNINAVPSTGYDFDGWSGGGVADSNLQSTSILLTSDHNLTAMFSVKKHSLTTFSNGGGTTSGDGFFDYGSSVSISASPSAGYVFSRWIGSGITNPSLPNTTITLTNDSNLTAVFSPKVYSVVVQSTEGGVATGSGKYGYGTVVDINATPLNGYYFSNWSGAVFADQNLSNAKITVLSDLNLTSVFSPSVHTLTLDANPGGSVRGGGSYSYGSSVSISATPDSGFIFNRWSGDTLADPSSPNTNLIIAKDSNLSAIFSPIEFTLTLNASIGGSVTGSGIYSFGSTASIRATPDSNYAFKGWKGGNLAEQNNSSVTLQLFSDNNLTAIFEKLSTSTLSQAEDLGASWFASWFGTFYETDSNWCYHTDLEWIFLSFDSSGGAWIWKENLGWLWTDPTRYKDFFLWSETKSDWIYLDLSSSVGPLVYHYASGNWTQL